MREKVGWIIFLIGFIVASVFAQRMPVYTSIPKSDYAFLYLIIAEAFLVRAYLDVKTRKLKGKDNFTKAEMIEFGLGILFAIYSLFVIFTKVQLQQWHVFFVGVLIGGIGLAILNEPNPHFHKSEDEEEDSRHINPLEWIDKIIKSVEEIDFEKMDTSSIKKSIEAVQSNLIIPFVESRHYFSHRFGVGRFAEFFSLFSSGERNINRAWSAIVDGYPEEAKRSIETALRYFKQTKERLSTYEEFATSG